MNMKTLLGTAAGLMVASSAYAADLPGEAAPVAVDYVKVCDAYGKGFFYIPGTDTCLKMSGRVRSRVVYQDGATIDPVTGKDTDSVTFKTDARVQFDARSESDLGTVRSFFGIKLDKGNIVADDAFIQVGYLTAGKMGFNADVFYGDTAAIYGVFDQSSTGIQLMVDDLGGGFYVGAAVQSSDITVNKWAPTVWTTGHSAELLYSGRVGIKGQPWGAFDVSALYQTFDDKNTGYHDTFAVRATADLKLLDKLSTRITGAYVDYDIDSYASIAGALKYQATDALAVYAGVAGSFWDKSDDTINAQIGADYALSKGLILTAEVNYLTDGGQNLNNKTSYYGNTDDSWSAMLKLTRNW